MTKGNVIFWISIALVLLSAFVSIPLVGEALAGLAALAI